MPMAYFTFGILLFRAFFADVKILVSDLDFILRISLATTSVTEFFHFEISSTAVLFFKVKAHADLREGTDLRVGDFNVCGMHCVGFQSFRIREGRVEHDIRIRGRESVGADTDVYESRDDAVQAFESGFDALFS